MSEENEEINKWDPMRDHASQESSDYQRGPGRNLSFQRQQASEVRDLFVTRIPAAFDEETITAHFSDAGEVIKVKLLPKKPDQEKLAAFVSYRNLRDAHRAVEILNGTPPVHYRVEFARPRESDEQRRTERAQDEARVEQYNASEARRIQESNRRYDRTAVLDQNQRRPYQETRNGATPPKPIITATPQYAESAWSDFFYSRRSLRLPEESSGNGENTPMENNKILQDEVLDLYGDRIRKGNPPCTYPPCPKNAPYACAVCDRAYCGQECRDLDFKRHRKEECIERPPLVQKTNISNDYNERQSSRGHADQSNGYSDRSEARSYSGRGGRGGYGTRPTQEPDGYQSGSSVDSFRSRGRGFGQNSYSRDGPTTGYSPRGRGGRGGHVGQSEIGFSADKSESFAPSNRGRGNYGSRCGSFSGQTTEREGSENDFRGDSFSPHGRGRGGYGSRGGGPYDGSFPGRVRGGRGGYAPGRTSVGQDYTDGFDETKTQAFPDRNGKATSPHRVHGGPENTQNGGPVEDGRTGGKPDPSPRKEDSLNATSNVTTNGGLVGQSTSPRVGGEREQRDGDSGLRKQLPISAEPQPAAFSGQRGRGFGRRSPLPPRTVEQAAPQTAAIPVMIPPADFKLDQKTEIEVLFVRNPHQMAVRPVSHKSVFDDLMDKVQKAARSPLTQFDAGGACVICRDNLWFRGEIVRLLPDDPTAVPVRFVDVGNAVKVLKSSLCTLDPTLATPALSRVVKLDQIPEPSGGVWERSVVDKFKEIVEPSDEYKLFMTVINTTSGGIPLVSMEDDQNNDVVVIYNCICNPSPANPIEPSAVPTVAPSAAPTVAPSAAPTVTPSATPIVEPPAAPTVAPSAAPTVSPAIAPMIAPAAAPTVSPHIAPATTEPVVPARAAASSVQQSARPAVQVATASDLQLPGSVLDTFAPGGTCSMLVVTVEHDRFCGALGTQEELQALLTGVPEESALSSAEARVGDIVYGACDGVYYRAVVENVSDAGYRLLYIDFGNKDTVKVVKAVPADKKSLNGACVVVKRDGVVVKTDDIISVKVLTPTSADVNGVELKVKPWTYLFQPSPQTPPVSPRVPVTASPVNPPTAVDGPAQPSSPESAGQRTTWHLPEPHGFVNGAFVYGDQVADTGLPLGDNQVLVQHVESLAEFYVVRCDPLLLREYTELEAEMMRHCEGMILSSYNPKLNEIVLAKYNDAWYRGAALQSEDDFAWTVYFPDYGNFETLKPDKIRRMEAPFMHLPFLVCPCYVQGWNDFSIFQRNIMTRVNLTNHVTEIRGYYAYHAPERGYVDLPEGTLNPLTQPFKDQVTSGAVAIKVIKKISVYYEVVIPGLNLGDA